MGYEQAIDKLERDIQGLRLRWERFLAGDLTPPLPEDIRAQIARDIRDLRNASLTGAADNFRLGNLEARFNTYSELYGRRLREREEGRAAVQHLQARERQAEHDATAGITLGARPDSAAVEALFNGLYRAAGQSPKFDLESFGSYIENQIVSIRQKTGCAEVQFRVSIEDGKPRLKAKPVGR